MRVKGARRTHAIFRNFLTPYVAMLAFPVLVALIIQSQTVSVVEQNTLSDNQLVLDQCRDIIDRYLEELSLTVQRLSLNKSISTFFSMDRVGRGDPQVYKLIEAHDAISSYSVTNRFVTELFLYARASDTLLSTKTVHINIDLDYRPFFRFGEIEPAMWRSELLSRTYRTPGFRPETVTLYGVKSPCIVAFQSIPLNSENSVGTVFALIDQGKIRELLSTITGEGGTVRVTDSGGLALLTAGDAHAAPPSVGDARSSGRWVVSSSASISSGWQYTSFLPRGFVMARVYRIKRIIWIGTAGFILAGFAVALLLAYRTSKPVEEIASLARSALGDHGRGQEDLAYIRDSMMRLVASNKQLEDARLRELPITRAAFLERLLRGAIQGEENLVALLRYNEIELQGDRFVVFVLGIQGFGDLVRLDILKELDLNRIVIRDAFTRRIPKNMYLVDLALDRMALIRSFDSAREDVESLEETMQAVRRELRASCRVDVVIAEGRVCTSLGAIHGSFEEAWKTIQSVPQTDADAGVLRHEERGAQGFFYPVEMESRLILLTRAGHEKEVDGIMRELYERNFPGRHLAATVLPLFCASLCGTLMRIVGEGEESVSLADVIGIQESPESPEARFALLRQAFHAICASAAARRRKTRERLIDRIVAFVKDSSSRSELNLSMAASAFGLKESYLYHLFKEEMGITFSAYLESLRIEGACALLRRSELPVDEIAERVGYGSAHSFRRAFKRRTSLSPTEFQRTHMSA